MNPSSNFNFSCQQRNKWKIEVNFFIEIDKQAITGVSLTAKKRNLLTIEQRAIFNSSMANLMPTQLRGPNPNGRKAYGFSLCLFSGAQLQTNDHLRLSSF
jgi:hypothetical protein